MKIDVSDIFCLNRANIILMQMFIIVIVNTTGIQSDLETSGLNDLDKANFKIRWTKTVKHSLNTLSCPN